MHKVRCSDGVGNQLFQLIFAKYIETKYNTEVALDISWFGESKYRNYSLDILDCEIKCKGRWWIILAKFLRYNSLITTICHTLNSYRFQRKFGWYKVIEEETLSQGIYNDKERYYFMWFFQKPDFVEYVRNNNPKIMDCIAPKDQIPIVLSGIQKEIANTKTSISIHVRRGDYTLPEWKPLDVCGKEYFEKAIKYVSERVVDISETKLFVFSDDIEWVKQNVSLPSSTVFVPNENVNHFWYIWLMSRCTHNIISNSTFSWWGAYLNKNNNKIVVCPEKWYNNWMPFFPQERHAFHLNELAGGVKIEV